MANEAETRGSGSSGNPERGGADDAQTRVRQPIGGGAIGREGEKSGRVGGEGHVSQESNSETDGGEPSAQTSSAGEESGQS